MTADEALEKLDAMMRAADPDHHRQAVEMACHLEMPAVIEALLEGASLDEEGALSIEAGRPRWKDAPADQLAWRALTLMRALGRLDGVTALQVTDRPLCDLGPLAGLGALEILKIEDASPVTDFSPSGSAGSTLAGLTGLRVLELAGCVALSDLSVIAGLSSLRELTIDAQPPTSWRYTARGRGAATAPGLVNLSPIAALPALESLKLCGLSSLRSLSSLRGSSLGALWLEACPGVVDPAPLAGLPSLLKVVCYDGLGKGGLAGFEALPALEVIALYGTEISDLTPLAGLTALRDLRLDGCAGLADLSPLAGKERLWRLQIKGATALEDLSPVSELTHLSFAAICGSERLRDLSPFIGLPRLISLNFEACVALTDLSPLADIPKLQWLGFRRCRALTDLRPLTALEEIRSLNLSSCPGVPKAWRKLTQDPEAIAAMLREHVAERGEWVFMPRAPVSTAPAETPVAPVVSGATGAPKASGCAARGAPEVSWWRRVWGWLAVRVR